MNKIINSFCISLLFLLFLFFAPLTQAHFAESDGTMTVTLHVDPNDNPIPGKQANLYFLFNDKSKKFQFKDCKCIVTVSKEGKQIVQKRVVQNKNLHLSVWGTYMPFIFPQKGIYHIALIGTPLTHNAFQPFSVFWDFRADPANPGIIDDDQPASSSSHTPDIEVLLSALVVVIIGVVLLGVFIKKQVLEQDTGSHKNEE